MSLHPSPRAFRRPQPDGDHPAKPTIPGQAAAGPVSGARLRVLDGLRVVAAAAVLFHHYTREDIWGHDAFGWLTTAGRYSWLGVELFFMISGFVICMSAWGRPLGGYLRSRVVRLGPAYWFCVLVTMAVLLLDGEPLGGAGPGLSQVLTNLTMFQTPLRSGLLDMSYWTLWSEVRFYLLFAVVAWTGLTYRKVLNFCWIWTVASLLAPTSGVPLFETLANPVYSPLFVSGICFFLIRREGPRAGEPWALLGLSWLLMQRWLNDIVAWNTVKGDRLSWEACLAVVTACYLVMAAVALRRLDRIDWRWLSVGGAMSYPLYLLHQQIGITLLRQWHRDVEPWTLLLSAVAVILLASWLVQRYVERPSARLLKQWLESRPARA
ncbi:MULTISPECIES: acyltransferase [unclassified Streptomyces]|uniref:acyltransferase family protein n=1 Tax=unclassified Streptomyces TaxID=2593676 RepID=UPI00109E4642|nr:acyltransferase [Streptomyces sp. A1136]THA55983.1 acyltransferase [Streptomyces sp. A1136]